jgi:putative transposase
MTQLSSETYNALDKAGPAAQKLTGDALVRIGLRREGLSYVINTGLSPPSRKVGRKRRRNLILDVPLRSMPGVVLQAESMTGEYNFLVELDRRRDLLAVYDQPITIKVGITDALGRSTRSTYTADYLVIDEKKAHAYEIKADCELERLVLARPKDWKLDGEGYHYLPARVRFAAMGIDHIVVPVSSLNALRADNLRMLTSSRDAPDAKKYRRARHGILELLTASPALRISEVLDRVGDPDETPILQLLDAEKIFADLDRVTLSDPSSVWISTSLEAAKAAHDASSCLAKLVHSELSTDDVIDPRYELEVATRLAIVEGNTRRDSKGKELSDRTLRRYRKAFRDAAGDPKGLLPKWRNCGNHESLIGEVHRAFLEAFIRSGKGDRNDTSVNACFDEYKRTFLDAKDKLGFFDDRPISRSTFYTYWDRAALHDEDSFNKGGRRLANEQADTFDPAKRNIVSTRPFAVAHIDHWKTDLHLVVGYINGVKITKRAWLTGMVDAFTGEILAIWLSFSDPSKKSCTMVIRDCVRRHGRLPEMIIVDGGSDFRSVHFFVMLATLKVVRCERPPEDPRFGQQVERLFKEFKDRFARGLPGFGISIERSRAVSAAFKAAKSSSLTLLEAFETMETFAFGGYNNSLKPGELCSRYAFRQKAERFYPHGGRKVIWDMKFLIASSIEAPDSDYTLWPGRGIHVRDKWYSSPQLLMYRGYKKDISVRLEPYADSVIYVCVEGRWLECRNAEAPLEFAMAEKSLLCRTAERQDLSAIRAELTNDMNRCAAEIVNEKLRDIASRAGSAAHGGKSSEPTDDETAEPPRYVQFNFDDIDPYENESP